jgi:hypothetical protein
MGVKSMSTLFLLGLAIFSWAPCTAAQTNDIAVVVNAENPAANLSLAELRKILAGSKRSWPGDLPIKLITRGPGTIERFALLRLLAMTESEYKQYWTAQVFRGEADAEPLLVPSVGMQKEAVKIFPGAISLLNSRDVKPGMKVIKIDGLLPGATGYPVH